jgi:predicted nucleic acid-binding protein
MTALSSALAAAANAVLITNDDHLLSARDLLGVVVQTPAEFVAGNGLSQR